MHFEWRQNIAENLNVIKKNTGPSLVTIVTGSQADKNFWQNYLEKIKPYSFRSDGNTTVLAVHEKTRKGNFIGTLNAWDETCRHIAGLGVALPEVSLMSMVFGQGTRLSPFTQALGNRKPAFPIPLKFASLDTFMCAADLSNIYANLWIEHLNRTGFRGVVVKWGDEAIIPSRLWSDEQVDFSSIDAVRFVWQTDITPSLATEKEWVIYNRETGLMVHQLTRQDADLLQKRVDGMGSRANTLAVNLGSLAVRYELLDLASKIFEQDVADPQKWVDWDPYVWIALCCQTEADWVEERAYELQIGKTGIQQLETRYPDFYAKIFRLRQSYEDQVGRPLAIKALDFGDAFWADIGLHQSLRKNLQVLTSDSETGLVSRDLYQIPQERDRNNNIILNSTVADSSQIHNSIILNSVIQGSAKINNGVIYGSCLRGISMPQGGAVIQCVVEDMRFEGPNAIAFQSAGKKIILREGDRHTTLLLPGRQEHLVSNEAITDYKGENYSRPILGNKISFEEASSLVEQYRYDEAEAVWTRLWDDFCR